MVDGNLHDLPAADPDAAHVLPSERERLLVAQPRADAREPCGLDLGAAQDVHGPERRARIPHVSGLLDRAERIIVVKRAVHAAGPGVAGVLVVPEERVGVQHAVTHGLAHDGGPRALDLRCGGAGGLGEQERLDLVATYRRDVAVAEGGEHLALHGLGVACPRGAREPRALRRLVDRPPLRERRAAPEVGLRAELCGELGDAPVSIALRLDGIPQPAATVGHGDPPVPAWEHMLRALAGSGHQIFRSPGTFEHACR